MEPATAATASNKKIGTAELLPGDVLMILITHLAALSLHPHRLSLNSSETPCYAPTLSPSCTEDLHTRPEAWGMVSQVRSHYCAAAWNLWI